MKRTAACHVTPSPPLPADAFIHSHSSTESPSAVCPASIIHAIWSARIIRDGKQSLSQKQIVGLERTEGIWLDNVRAGSMFSGTGVRKKSHVNDSNEAHSDL